MFFLCYRNLRIYYSSQSPIILLLPHILPSIPILTKPFLTIVLVLIGDLAIGKSHILDARFVKNKFYLDPKVATSVKFQSMTLVIQHESIKLHVWETVGRQYKRTQIFFVDN